MAMLNNQMVHQMTSNHRNQKNEVWWSYTCPLDAGTSNLFFRPKNEPLDITIPGMRASNERVWNHQIHPKTIGRICFLSSCQSQWCPLFNGCDPSVNGKKHLVGKGRPFGYKLYNNSPTWKNQTFWESISWVGRPSLTIDTDILA